MAFVQCRTVQERRARSAAPRGERARRRVQQKRQEENGNLSQGQGRYDVASLGGEERRGAVTVDVGSGELRQCGSYTRWMLK